MTPNVWKLWEVMGLCDIFHAVFLQIGLSLRVA
jgi:hypothetical protein